MLAGPRLRCSLRDERNSSVFLIGEASLATERAAALQAAQSSSWCEDIAAAMHRAWSCDASVSARGALGQAVGAAPVAGMSLSMASSSIPRCTLGAPIYRLRSSQIERCHPRRGKWTADPGERVQLGPHGWDLAGEGEVSHLRTAALLAARPCSARPDLPLLRSSPCGLAGRLSTSCSHPVRTSR